MFGKQGEAFLITYSSMAQSLGHGLQAHKSQMLVVSVNGMVEEGRGSISGRLLCGGYTNESRPLSLIHVPKATNDTFIVS